MPMILGIIDYIGLCILQMIKALGNFTLFLIQIIKVLCSTRLKMQQIILHMYQIGIGSLLIILLTGSFTGLALTLQSYIGFHRLGAEEFIGLVVALGMSRELGPVLTGLMITGRCGSSMAAEIGTMQVTEQIDAIKTLGINPYQYLLIPRLLAATIILPFLTSFSVLCGILSGYLFCINVLNLNADTYISIIQEKMELSDITGGLIKSSFFGFISALVGTYHGYTTTGGARGVGEATTWSVVTGSIMILIANYLLSSILFQTGI